MAFEKRYTAIAYLDKGKNIPVYAEDYATREAAAVELFTQYPTLKTCSTGYGYHGSFDIRWHDKPKVA